MLPCNDCKAHALWAPKYFLFPALEHQVKPLAYHCSTGCELTVLANWVKMHAKGLLCGHVFLLKTALGSHRQFRELRGFYAVNC